MPVTVPAVEPPVVVVAVEPPEPVTSVDPVVAAAPDGGGGSGVG